MPAPPFTHRNLPLLLLRTREEVISRFRPILQEHGVTEQQWRIVRALAEHGDGLEVREIAMLCAISGPSLTGVLARMDAQGLVRRQRPAGDRRRLVVTLTPASRALVRSMAPRIEREYAALERAAGAGVVREAYASLDRLCKALARRG